jgi:hypothetical protein
VRVCPVGRGTLVLMYHTVGGGGSCAWWWGGGTCEETKRNSAHGYG